MLKENQYHRRFPCFSILDRYVGGEYILSYLIAIGVVLSLRVLIDLFVQFDEFMESAPGVEVTLLVVLGKVCSFYGPKLFEYYRDFSGIIILLAATFALVRMNRNNELTAVLACGISLKRLIAPVIVLGLLFNLVMVADQELILPGLADKLSRQHDETDQMRSLRLWLLPDRDGALVSAGEYDPQEKVLRNVLIILRKDGQMTGRITAQEGRDWDGLGWTLVNGRFEDFRDENQRVKAVHRYLSDLSPEYLWLQRNSDYKSLMSSRELTGLLGRSLRPVEYSETISERHFRFTDPIINITMLLLGLPMLVSRENRSTRTAILFSFGGAGGCFLVTFGCKLMGGGTVDPLLAAWLPIILFLPLSVIALEGIKT